MMNSAHFQPRRQAPAQRLRGLLGLISLIVVTGAMSPEQGACAADILDYLPEDSLGFVVVRDIGPTDAQVMNLMQ